MSKVEETSSIPGLMSGILHPAMANRFRVLIDNSNLLAQQVTKVRIDMVQRLIQVSIEQPVGMSQQLLDEIDRLSDRSRSFPHPFKFPIRIELLGGDGNSHSAVDYFGHVEKHEYVLDYAKNEAASHELFIRYTRGA